MRGGDCSHRAPFPSLHLRRSGIRGTKSAVAWSLRRPRARAPTFQRSFGDEVHPSDEGGPIQRTHMSWGLHRREHTHIETPLRRQGLLTPMHFYQYMHVGRGGSDHRHVCQGVQHQWDLGVQALWFD